MPSVADTLYRKLTENLSPTQLDIIDESAHHAGHAGARAGGESHFQVRIEAAAFAGLNRVARQRLVYRILAAELAGPVHALTLITAAPGEGQAG